MPLKSIGNFFSFLADIQTHTERHKLHNYYGRGNVYIQHNVPVRDFSYEPVKEQVANKFELVFHSYFWRWLATSLWAVHISQSVLWFVTRMFIAAILCIAPVAASGTVCHTSLRQPRLLLFSESGSKLIFSLVHSHTNWHTMYWHTV